MSGCSAKFEVWPRLSLAEAPTPSVLLPVQPTFPFRSSGAESKVRHWWAKQTEATDHHLPPLVDKVRWSNTATDQ